MATARVVPAEDELVEALSSIRMREPSLGFKKVFQKVREQRPNWDIDNAAKERMRKLFRASDSEANTTAENSGPTGYSTTVDNSSSGSRKSSSAGTTAASSSASAPSSSARRSRTTAPSFIPGQHTGSTSANAEAEPDLMGRVIRGYLDMAKERPPNGFTKAPELMSPELLQAIMRGESDMPIPNPTDLGNNLDDSAHKMFWAEWKCFIGPHVEEPLPPPVPFVPNEEPARFFMLFPYGIGGWLGPTGHPTPVTFEEYAHHMLRLADPRFRHSREWLEWVLTRTQDKGLAGSVNEALVVFFDSKARHLGKGRIERKRVEDNFDRKQLRDGVLV